MTYKLATGGALAALAAALALAAVPAEAREARRDFRENAQPTAPQRGGQDRPAPQRGNGWSDPGRTQPVARPERTAPQAQPQRSGWPQAQQQRPVWPQAQPQRTAPSVRAERTPGAVPYRGQVFGQRDNRQADTRPPRDNRQADSRPQRDGRDSQADRADRNRTYADSGRNRTYTAQRNDDRRGNDRDWRENRGGNTQAYRDSRRDDRRWDRRWRDNSRYDWQRYRTYNRNAYHVGRYYAPYRNYNYRPLSIGFYLDALFYSDRYWIADPWQYRLPEVYGPYRWVRYYDDALLIDIYSGQVVDVIHDFFW